MQSAEDLLAKYAQHKATVSLVDGSSTAGWRGLVTCDTLEQAIQVIVDDAGREAPYQVTVHLPGEDYALEGDDIRTLYDALKSDRL